MVPQYERAVIFRLGRIRDDEAKGPGMFFLLPCIDKFVPVDIRTKSFDVPPQRVSKGGIMGGIEIKGTRCMVRV